MCHRVDDRFPDRDRRQVPPVCSQDRADVDAVQTVLTHEPERVFHREYQVGSDLCLVDDLGLVGAEELSGLDPGIGEKPGTVLVAAEQQQAADGRDELSLVGRHQSEGLQVGGA